MTQEHLDEFIAEAESAVATLGELRDRAQLVVDRQRPLWRSEHSSWVVAPGTENGHLVWRVAFTDAEARRRAEEVIAAFLGPPIALIDRGVARSRPGYATSDLAVVGGEAALIDALEILVAVRASEPPLPAVSTDPVAFLLRDLRLALAAADSDASTVLLQRIESAGLLSRDNIRFLRVELLARLSRWTELASLPWLVDLSRAKTPRHITEYLLEALWRVHFGDAIVLPGQGLRTFEALGLDEIYRTLLDAVDVPARPVARRLIWLWAVCSGDEPRQLRIREATPADELVLLDHLIQPPTPTTEVVTEPPIRPPLLVARDLLDDGEFGSAVLLAESHPDDAAVVAVALRAAHELGDPELAARAIALVTSAVEAQLPTTPGFLRDLAHVRSLAANRCPGWLEWLERIARPNEWPDAAQVARGAAEAWPVNELSDATAAGRAANLLIAGIDGVNERQVAAVLDLLCEVAEQLAQQPGCEVFLDAVLIALAAQENLSNSVRGAFVALVIDVLASAPDASRYREIVELASDLWARVRSAEALSWALDLLDVFVVSPSPEPGTRTAFASAVAVGALAFAGRIPSHQRAMLIDLATECQAPVELPEPPAPDPTAADDDPWAKLTSRLVGLYSLLDGVGVRFRGRLLSLNPDVRVEHNADTVATDALRGLARSADYLIVDTRHAAHQATGAIDEVRPRHRQLFPAGRGLSSFVDRLRVELQATA